MGNQLYWVIKSYTTRKTLWFFFGYYVLATIGFGAFFSEAIPSLAFILLLQAQLGLIAGLWLQFRAQTVTTVGTVAPRFWLPHQIVLAAMIFFMWGIQSLTMFAMRADLLAAAAVYGLLFIPWATMQLTHDRVLAGDPAADKFRATAVLVPMACALLFFAGPILLSDQFIDRFFAGAYPQLAWMLFGAGVVSVAMIVRGMPLRHRVLNESSNQGHSCEVSWGQWIEWSQRNQQQHSAKLQEKINRVFSTVSPGCARHGDRQRAAHLRKANDMTGKNLLFFCMMLAVMTWVVQALMSLALNGDMSWLFGGAARTAILSMPLMAPSLMLLQQWDLRRRTFVIELMRPVARRELFRDLVEAIAADTAIIAAVHTMNILVYAAITRQSMQWSVPVVVLMLAGYCLIATTTLTLLTYPQNRRGVVVVSSIVVLLVVEIVSIDALFSSNVGSPAIELFAVAAVVLLFAFAFTARKRWRNLEWDA
ncbi:MAG: hypothetical protein WD065_14575 [Planctomycetaceae bacterium]